jgi:glutamine synthetase type III
MINARMTATAAAIPPPIAATFLEEVAEEIFDEVGVAGSVCVVKPVLVDLIVDVLPALSTVVATSKTRVVGMIAVVLSLLSPCWARTAL